MNIGVGVGLPLPVVGNSIVVPEVAKPNMLLYSENFSNAAWTKGNNSTGVGNNITMTAATSTYVSQLVTVEVGKSYTFTVWAKANAGNYAQFDIYAGNSTWFGQDYGRTICTPTDTETAFSFTFTATATNAFVGFDNMANVNVVNILASAKLEQGTTSTAYIRTP